MNGYFRPRHLGLGRELRPLTLCEIEYVTEDGTTENQNYLGHGWPHQCPRCEAQNHIATNLPYCSECNWDSVTDAA